MKVRNLGGKNKKMIGKFLLWAGVYFGFVVLMSYDFATGMLVMLLTPVMIIFVAHILSAIRTYLEYNRNIEDSILIGRMTCGMDHKGRATHRIIWY